MSEDINTDTARFVIEEEAAGERLDKTLNALDEGLSRGRLKTLIEAGQVTLNGAVCTNASKKLKAGDALEVIIPPPVAANPQPENIPLDIVYEDSQLLVLNKPAGLIVHPGAGNPSGTLVNALLHHCGDSLSGINGVLRPGIVHRLDKETTGLMVVAKTDAAHRGLAAQLEDRSLTRIYTALALGVIFPPRGTIDQPIGRHPVNRREMMVTRKNSREAVTHYEVMETYGGTCSLVSCRLSTGRTHQIRVHMAWLRHPLIGDPVYRAQPTALAAILKKGSLSPEAQAAIRNFPRQALHAGLLSFIHPTTGEQTGFEAPLPEDLSNLLKLL